MLNLAFDKIEGLGYNNVFSTGNLKKAVTGWCAYYLEGDRQGLTAAVNYTGLVRDDDDLGSVGPVDDRQRFVRVLVVPA